MLHHQRILQSMWPALIILLFENVMYRLPLNLFVSLKLQTLKVVKVTKHELAASMPSTYLL